MDNSLCFGLYYKKDLIGFARVLTDGVVIAYLMDVYVQEKYRGVGLGKHLIREILSHPDLIQIPDWLLATNDAHGLYRQFDFKPLSNPDFFMER